jgi:hydrogenase-4 component E
LTDVVLIALGTTMIFVAATSRVEGYVKALAAQGLLLFLLVLSRARELEPANLAFLAVETLGVKAIAVPLLLMKTVRRHEISRDSSPAEPVFWPTAASCAILVAGLAVGAWAARSGGVENALYFGASFAMILASLAVIVTRRKIITQVLGYMMMENGVFLLSTAVAAEMPLIVDLGVLLDVFVGIYVIAAFFNKIQALGGEGDIDELSSLKD